jgi:tetratricopeptide (TPR) repeat protein
LPHIELGNALLEMGHIEEARSHFTHVLNQKPNQPRACLGLAQCSFEEGHWAAATELARNAVEHGGANFAALLLLGRAARLAGLGEESRDALHRADALMETTIESNPDAPEGYFLRGEVYFAREDWAKALENYRAADDRADPKTEYAAYGMHFNRLDILAKAGVCFQRLGRLEQAREVGRRIVEHNPDHKIGVALAALGGEESTT